MITELYFSLFRLAFVDNLWVFLSSSFQVVAWHLTFYKDECYDLGVFASKAKYNKILEWL